MTGVPNFSLCSILLVATHSCLEVTAFLPPLVRTPRLATTCFARRSADVARRSDCESRVRRRSTPHRRTLKLSMGAVSRGHAIRMTLLSAAAGLTLCPKQGFALDPKRQFEEMMRIRRQEEADNLLGGGELASPEGGKTIEPVLTLIPIVK